MTGRNYLKQARTALSRVEMLKEQINWLREDMQSVRSVVLEGAGVQSNAPHDQMARRVANICDKIGERETQIAYWENVLSSVETVINEVDDVVCCKILYAKYVRGLKICEIAEEMGYSKSYVYALHNKSVKEIIPNENIAKI